MRTELLIMPDAHWLDEVAAYRQAFLAAGDSMDGTGSLRQIADPAQWLQSYEDYQHHPERIPANHVPATQFLYVCPEEHTLLGMLNFRHTLNDHLRLYGGHIGYSVHPQHRRQGVATRMLSAALPYGRRLGLERVLITCFADNEGSRRTILRNGGVYEGESLDPGEGKYIQRYWVPLPELQNQ